MKLAAAVLAAGAARRFGADKLLQPLGGRPVLHHALDRAAAAPADELLLIAGSGAVAAAGRQWCGSARLRILDVDTADEGLGGSLRATAEALEADTKGLFIFLGDMPFVPARMATRLAELVATGAAAAAPVCRGQRGHPVLIGPGLLSSLHRLAGERGAAALLRDAALLESEDDGVLFDIDTPAALAVAERRLAQQQRPLPPL